MTQLNGSFGIRVLDERVSGPSRGGLHALIGGPGTGKTIAALQFLAQGVRQGGRVAHLTQARPEDVIALAGSIGIDLHSHLESGRWLLLGYQQGFRQRYRRTIEPREVFEELASFVGDEEGIERLVIDTCGPLVDLRESGNGAELLLEAVSDLGATALITFSAEHPGALDNAFDFISQRASLILHMTMSTSGRRQFVVRKTSGPRDGVGPISFEIQDGVGIVPAEGKRQERATDLSPEVRRRVLLLDMTGELPPELRLWFEESYEFQFAKDPVDAFPELARKEFGVVVLHVDRHSVDRGLHVMHQLRRAAGRPPILVICPYDLRASDRARALRSGADDFISGGGLNPEELESRIQALLRRARTAVGTEEAPEITAPEDATSGVKVERVNEIVRERLARRGSPIFSLVLLRPTNGTPLEALATRVAELMRQDSGDRLSVSGGRIEVFLDGALSSHAQRFLGRVRSEYGEKVSAVVYTSPTDRPELLKVIEEQDG